MGNLQLLDVCHGVGPVAEAQPFLLAEAASAVHVALVPQGQRGIVVNAQLGHQWGKGVPEHEAASSVPVPQFGTHHHGLLAHAHAHAHNGLWRRLLNVHLLGLLNVHLLGLLSVHLLGLLDIYRLRLLHDDNFLPRGSPVAGLLRLVLVLALLGRHGTSRPDHGACNQASRQARPGAAVAMAMAMSMVVVAVPVATVTVATAAQVDVEHGLAFQLGVCAQRGTTNEPTNRRTRKNTWKRPTGSPNPWLALRRPPWHLVP